jgi:hypothetical protein
MSKSLPSALDSTIGSNQFGVRGDEANDLGKAEPAIHHVEMLVDSRDYFEILLSIYLKIDFRIVVPGRCLKVTQTITFRVLVDVNADMLP